MVTLRTLNMTLDIGQFYIIFSIFAGMITATIAYFYPFL